MRRYWNKGKKALRGAACAASFALSLAAPAAAEPAAPAETAPAYTLSLPGVSVELAVPPRSLWNLPVDARPDAVEPSLKSLEARIVALNRSPDESEPIVLRLRDDVAALLRQLAKDEILKGLAQPLIKEVVISAFERKLAPRLQDGRLAIVPADLDWLNLAKLSKLLKVQSVTPSIRRADWERLFRSEEGQAALLEHLGASGEDVVFEVESWLDAHPAEPQLPLKTFLPTHLRAILGRFSPVKGRNCFATALSFADGDVFRVGNVNPVAEKGYFAAMINHDEFQNALWLGYYPLAKADLARGLQLGDVVVFYDADKWPSYRSLRHAAVHVAGDVYLHKQNKSPSSPVEFTQWESLVKSWSRLSPTLDYQVYRRMPAASRRFDRPSIAIERLSWDR